MSSIDASDEELLRLVQKYHNEEPERASRGLRKEDYDAIMARSEDLAKNTMQLLRKIDELILDAAEQFDRFQQHRHGTLMIAYLSSGKARVPFVCEVLDRAEGGFRIFRMTKSAIAQWSVARNWDPSHLNPGGPLKNALRAISDLLNFRVEVYAYFVGRPFMGVRAMENRWGSLYLRVAGALDSMSRSIKHDWVRVRKDRAAGILPPRRKAE